MSKRYEKGHKATTRSHIVETASAKFRREGYESVGIAGLMADAGLTHGGFYAHFGSKEHLMREAIVFAFDQRRASLEAALAKAEPGRELEAVVTSYLSELHRDRPDLGCMVASLAPEVARLSLETRQVFTEKVLETAAVFARAIAEGTDDERQAKGLAIFSSLIGALQIARTLPDRAASAAVLRSARELALSR
jgi:TetR/AcrR family transcriptional repressor of nem operon